MHPLDSIAARAWNAIKSPTQPEYDSLGVEFQGTLCEKAAHARSGQPIEEGDHPYARFERKVVELSAEPETVLPLDPAPNPNPALTRFFADPFHKEIPVTAEGSEVHVPSFEVPSASDTERRVGDADRRSATEAKTVGVDRREGVADRRMAYSRSLLGDLAVSDPIDDLSPPSAPEFSPHGLDHKDDPGGTPV